jgi:signal peptidase II
VRLRRGNGSRSALFIATAAAALSADVVSKAVAVGGLTPGRPVPVFGDSVSLALIRNSGAALSWGDDYPMALTFLVAAVVGAVAWRGTSVVSPAAAFGLGLVLGGAAGNLTDRLFRAPGPLRGAVVDFVSVGWSPTFNAADVSVLSGVLVLAWLVLAKSAAAASQFGWDDADEPI